MANLANCPTDAELRELLLGKGVESVGEHLLDCPYCGANAGRLVASDPMLAELRAAHDTSEIGTDGTFVEDLLRRIKQPSTAKTLPNTELDFLDPAKAEFPTDLGMFNHYRIVEKIGEGGMGMVFRAVDSHLQRTVALKIILPKYAANQKLRDRFIEEARATVKVRSPHVAEVYETNVWKDVPYLTMELLVGTTLDKKPRPMAVDALRRIGFSIAKGLADAHRSGMIHRDLKPSNIHLGTDARTGKPTVKLIDFGLARPVNRDIEITKSGELLGTPAYMSPEQARGKKVDHRTDLYSLGVILHQLATGKLPYDSASEGVMAILTELATPEPLTSVAQRTETLPPSLAKLIDRLLAKDPANRPASADEVMKVLRESLNEKVDPNASGTAVAESAPFVSVPDATGPYEASIAFSEMKTEPDAPAPKPGRRWLWPALGVGTALAALVVAFLAGAFNVKVKTKDGTIEIADLPADAEVVVDGNVVTLTWDAGKTKATATIPAGQHTIEVKASGITTTGERVTLAAGERKPVTFQFRKPDQPTPTTVVRAEQPPYGKELIRNGGCDDAALSHWTRVSGGWYQNHHDRGPTFCAGDCAWGVLQQEVDVSAFAKDIDSGEVGFGFHVLFNTYDADTTRCVVQYLDAKGKIIGDGYDTGERAHRWVWVPYSGMVIAPAGTRTVLVVLQSRRSKRPGNKQNSGYYDDVSLWAVHVPKGTETVPLYKSKEKADYTNALGMKFVRVPAGTAWLDGYSGKPGEREVTFPTDYYLGMYEVTQAEWQKVMGSNPSHFSRNGKGAAAVKDESDATIGQLPVESITANDAAKFLAKLNELTKESGWIYRLPTGDEWEYACRGGPIPKSEAGFDFYAGRPGYSMGAALANFDLANKRTLPVGSYPPNRLGLFDMHGNVWEMLNRQTDVNGKPVQISRGGCWDNIATHCRAAHTITYDPTPGDYAFGLRVVRVPVGTPAVGRLFADSKRPSLRYFGYSIQNANAATIAKVADYTSAIFDRDWQKNARQTDAAKAASRPVFAVIHALKGQEPYTAALRDYLRKRRDVVAGVLWQTALENGNTFDDLALFGKTFKAEFPDMQFWVMVGESVPPQFAAETLPATLDGVVATLWQTTTPAAATAKVEAALAAWKTKAAHRPTMIMWTSYDGTKAGVAPRTQPGTLRATVAAAQKHGAVGIVLDCFDARPDAEWKGIEGNPALVTEIEAVATEFGIAVPSRPAIPLNLAKLPAVSPGTALQYFVVGFNSRADLIAPFAPSSNLLFASGLPDAQPFIDAARTAKRPLVLAFGGKSRNEVEGKLFPIVEKNRDVVAGICWSLPYGNGYTPADVAALGTAIKNRFPGLSYSVSFGSKPADPTTPTVIPPEVDLVVVNLYGDNTPEKVRTKTDLVLPDWIARANGRPLILRWAAWEVDMGLVPRTDAGTFRACVDAAKKHKVAGVAFEPIDDDPRGFKGIATNPVLTKEIVDLGRELGFAAQAPAASPVDRNRFNIRKGRWSIVGDELAQTDTGEPYAAIEFGDENWTDYDYKVDVKRVQGKDQIALLYRWMQPSSFGLFGIGTAGNTFGVVEWQQAGKTGFLQRFDNRLPNDEWQTLIVKVRGDRITCQLNPGTKTALSWEAVNDRQPRGKVGLRVGYSHARFRNIKVTAPDGTVLWEGLPNLDGSQATVVPPFTNALGMKFARVPKGTVPLGGRDGKPGTVPATVAEDFYLGTYEVTQEEWQAVMGTNPSVVPRVNTAGQDLSAEALKRFPVNNVSWVECREFAKKLNERLKETGWEYRLPTATEWEYACRGGPSNDTAAFGSSFYAGSPANALKSDAANFSESGLKRPCAVGRYAPNRLGLYDMHGNVAEWCDDEKVPDGVNGTNLRANRGGGWSESADYCRPTWLSRWKTDDRRDFFGLRIARVPVAGAPGPVSKFAPLFNGKDLAGWEAVGNANATWKVEAGELVGGWKNSDFVGGSTLETKRKDYRHFRLKVVAKPSENWPNRIFCLPPFQPAAREYFKVWIGTEKEEANRETGRLTLRANDAAPLLAKAKLAADAWNTIEVEVRGNRVQVFVDGVKTADQTDDRLPAGGHAIGLHLTGGATLRIKTLEIEELTAPGTPASK